MGIFDLFKNKQNGISQKVFKNDVENKLYDTNSNYRNIKDSIDYQNTLLARINNANSQYAIDNDLDTLISVYEDVFINSNPPCNSSQCRKLIGFYEKNGQNDKAWGYMNYLLATGLDDKSHIRIEQAKLLRKEKKYQDAIEMYMLGYLAKSEWNNTFQPEMFKKDIQSSANKLKLDADKVDYLSALVGKQVERRQYDEKSLIDLYRTTITEFEKG